MQSRVVLNAAAAEFYRPASALAWICQGAFMWTSPDANRSDVEPSEEVGLFLAVVSHECLICLNLVLWGYNCFLLFIWGKTFLHHTLYLIHVIYKYRFCSEVMYFYFAVRRSVTITNFTVANSATFQAKTINKLESTKIGIGRWDFLKIGNPPEESVQAYQKPLITLFWKFKKVYYFCK